MPILIKMNLKCNFACDYCYQHPIREKEIPEWMLDRVEETIKTLHEKDKAQIIVHGGEPLLMSKEVLERLLKLAFDSNGSSSIQTNGYLIDSDIIEMFKKYKTGVGISVDGPWPCNRLRGIGTEKMRKKQTERVLANLDRLVEHKVSTSIIAVIHQANALEPSREVLKSFIERLSDKKVQGRLNVCASGNSRIDLEPLQAVDFYDDMYHFMEEKGIFGWSPFKDITNSLLGKRDVVCTFQGCDPLCTNAAVSVLPTGNCGVCLRLYSDGKMYLRDTCTTTMRTELLEESECKDCQWFNNCHGGCSGLAVDFDWRHKDRYCELYKALFNRTAKTLKFLGCEEQTAAEKPGEGFEHLDGGTRHLDSSYGKEHTDGHEHIDGSTRHLDSNLRR